MIGEIVTCTLVEREMAPAGFEWCAPYVLAVVELESGLRLTTQITDLDLDMASGRWVLPKIGDKVEMVTRKLREDSDERSIIIYGYKFRPGVR